MIWGRPISNTKAFGYRGYNHLHLKIHESAEMNIKQARVIFNQDRIKAKS